MPDICVQIGRRIRSRRKANKLSQKQLAWMAEIAEDSLSKLENGKREAGFYTLGRIVKALGVTMAEFFEGM